MKTWLIEKGLEKLLTDVTQIRTKEENSYLMVIQDLYNKEKIECVISENNGMKLIKEVIDRWI
ncbi:hypothetical protein [Fervidobacterium sp.]